MIKPLRVKLDTSPLGNAHAHRGIGIYTQLLANGLKHHSGVEFLTASQPKPDEPKPDVVHYPYFDLYFSTLPLRHPAPSVVTIHDVIPLLFPDHYPPGFKGWGRYIRQWLALRRVTHLITDSQASSQNITDHLNIDPARISVVPLAGNPDIEPQAPARVDTVRRRYGIPPHYLLYVGDINYNKNLPQLIKTLKYLPEDLTLVLLGKHFVPKDIPEWQAIELQIAMSNVADRVVFVTDLGGDKIDDVAALYTGAVVYVQPSLAEGFGLPVLEAMQCGAPVVCSNVSALPEVGADQAVYADPTAESLAEGVSEVIGWSQTKRQRRAKSARAWAEQFSWNKVVEQTLAVYRQVAA